MLNLEGFVNEYAIAVLAAELDGPFTEDAVTQRDRALDVIARAVAAGAEQPDLDGAVELARTEAIQRSEDHVAELEFWQANPDLTPDKIDPAVIERHRSNGARLSKGKGNNGKPKNKKEQT